MNDGYEAPEELKKHAPVLSKRGKRAVKSLSNIESENDSGKSILVSNIELYYNKVYIA